MDNSVRRKGETVGSQYYFQNCRSGDPGFHPISDPENSGREEQAFLVSLAGLLVVLFWIVPYIYELFDSIKKLFEL